MSDCKRLIDSCGFARDRNMRRKLNKRHTIVFSGLDTLFPRSEEVIGMFAALREVIVEYQSVVISRSSRNRIEDQPLQGRHALEIPRI